MEAFASFVKRQGLPAQYMPQARKALNLAKSRHGVKVVKAEVTGEDIALVDSEGDEVTYDDLIRVYGIDRYVAETGDGPEQLKDLLRF